MRIAPPYPYPYDIKRPLPLKPCRGRFYIRTPPSITYAPAPLDPNFWIFSRANKFSYLLFPTYVGILCQTHMVEEVVAKTLL